MKKLGLFLGSLILIGAVLAALAGFYVIYSGDAPGPLNESKIVLIERGTGTSSIARILEQEDVISSALVFKIHAALKKNEGSLKAGEYEFPASISLNDAMTMIREGRVYDRKITFAEGLTSHQIVKALNNSDVLTGEIAVVPADGALLPETYHFIKGDTRQGILDQMTDAMTKTTEELWSSRSADLPFDTIEQAVALASIVEKETGVASERGKVAGVFINRLRRGMPLQSDPTVIYAMTKGVIENEGQGPIGRRLLTKDLAIDSPYNTYRYPGIPPSAIANPGRDSIRAVLHPEIHDYVYFVADGTGGHAFSRTLSEHNANVAKWRRIRRAQD